MKARTVLWDFLALALLLALTGIGPGLLLLLITDGDIIWRRR